MSARLYLRRFTILAASSLTVISGAAISPALPEIHRAFADLPQADFWIKFFFTLPALAIALGAPVAGFLTDHFGRRRLFILGLGLFGLAGGAGLFLQTFLLLCLSRFCMGFAVSCIMVSATTLIADYHGGVQRTRVLGHQAAFMAFGGMFFLSFGGVLADFHWRAPFTLYLAGMLLLPFAFFTIREVPRNARHHTQESDLDLSFLPGQTLLLFGLAFLGMVAFYMLPTYLPFYVESHSEDLPGLSRWVSRIVPGAEGWDGKSAQTGLALSLSTLFSAIVSVVYRRLKGYCSYGLIYSLVCFLMGSGFWLINHATAAGCPWEVGYRYILLSMVAIGAGMGLYLPNLNSWLTEITPARLRGRVLGGLTACMFLGQFVSPLIVEPIAQSQGLARAYAIAGSAILFVGVAFLLSSLWRWSRRFCPLQQEPEGDS